MQRTSTPSVGGMTIPTGPATGSTNPIEIPPSDRSSESNRQRIVGIDVARGLAILGMIGVHILNPGPFPWASWVPGDWDRAFAGRSSILFAVIAGISLTFLSGRTRPVKGVPLLQARMRIVVRALTIFAVGGILSALDTNVAVILEYYAVLFVLALPFLTWRSRHVLRLAAFMMLAGPLLHVIVMNLVARQEFGRWTMLTQLTVTGRYPAIVWIAYVLLGLGIGRLALDSLQVQVRLLTVGAAMMLVGYAGGQLAKRLFPMEQMITDQVPGRFDLSRMATMEPHSGTWFEVVGSSGVALMIIAICLLLTVRLGKALYPLAAAGSMALSVYVVHVVSMVWIHPTFENQYQIFLSVTAITILLASIWLAVLGKGPLERMLAFISQRFASTAS